jgi:hypothetical protein
MAGHAAYDAERHGLAQRYYLAGLHAARESGDRALGAHILGCMGQQATHQGQLGDAERLFLAARSGAGGSLSAAESGNLCALLARVYARRGERVLVERYANEAMEYAAGARADEAPAWIYWCDTTMITALVGEAYLAATHTMGPGQGIGEKAEQRLQIGCDGFDPTERPRERAMWTLFRADACIARGDQEQASLLVRKATTLAETVQSTHLTHHIGELRAALA